MSAAAEIAPATDVMAQVAMLPATPADYTFNAGQKTKAGKGRKVSIKQAAANVKAKDAKRRQQRGRLGEVLRVGSYAQVYKGRAERTTGGLRAKDILRKEVKVRDSKGKVQKKYRYVSKARS